MRKASIGITPEGAPAIFGNAFASLISAILGWWPPAVFFFLLGGFCLHFFRDPERVVPQGAGLCVSPADGKIVRVAPASEPFSGEVRQCISIFMNVFSVHVNRSPVEGIIKSISYHQGRFLNASLDKSSHDNERCAYLLEDGEGRHWTMVQVAGLVARRIVCRVDEGDSLKRGDRYGMIKFGSRVDVYLPEGYHPNILVGDQVLAGQSVLARRTDN